MKNQKKKDIILYSVVLKNLLVERFKQLGMKHADIVRDAKEKGMTTITQEKLSRYFRNDIPIYNFPTQEDILWLSARWGISISLKVNYEDWDEKKFIAKSDRILKAIKNG